MIINIHKPSPAKGKYISSGVEWSGVEWSGQNIVTGHTARIDGHNSARRDQTQQ
jgi:hypothetical protein